MKLREGQLSLDLFPVDVAAPEPRPEPKARAPESPRGQAPSAAEADDVAGAARRHAEATALLDAPDGLLTRTHLRELGLERRAVDAVFRALAVVALPGYSRPMIRVRDYLELIEHCTFRDDRVRPSARVS